MRGIKFIAHKHLKFLTYFILVIVSILILFAGQTPALVQVKDAGLSMFTWFQSGTSSVSNLFSGISMSFTDRKKMEEDLKISKERLEKYYDALDELQALRKENIQLRSQIGFLDNIPFIYSDTTRRIPAIIIGKQPGNFTSSFTLNKGQKDGVKPNMPVIARYDEFYGLVGKIATVGFGTSMVMPLYNDLFYVAAQFDKSIYEGLINGLGEDDSHVILQYVEKTAKSDINYGDLVVTSGMGRVFPKGIHIGKVTSIISKPYQTSMEFEIMPVIDFSRLQYVFVIETGEANEQ
jgi:rod shape-determining protein MreC